MGKKSRRNKKTGNVAAPAPAAATVTTYSTYSGCFHGSTIDKFQPNSDYMKAYEEYIIRQKQKNESPDYGLDLESAFDQKYDKDYKHLIEDPEFCRFIFAYCTEQYLLSNNLQHPKRKKLIVRLLLLGWTCRYENKMSSERCSKYLRDIATDRGIINCLAREIETYCDCMNEGKDIAKTMDKVAKCPGCYKEFPKETLSFCSGCQSIKYHNRECQINDWPNHKLHCKKWQEVHKEVSRIESDNPELKGFMNQIPESLIDDWPDDPVLKNKQRLNLYKRIEKDI